MTAQNNEIFGLISQMNAAVSNIRLYSSEHPQVRRYLEQAHATLDRLLRSRHDITFIIVDEELVVDNQALTSQTPHVAQFIQLFENAGVERITFQPPVSLPELARLAEGLTSDDHLVRSSSGIKVGKIKVSAAEDGADAESVAPEVQERIEGLRPVREQSLHRLKELYHDFKTDRSLTVKGFGEIVRSFIQGIHKSIPPLHALASLKRWDEYTFTHAINVCILTMAQAEALGIRDKTLHDIGIAASMHDAGKVFVPDQILNKPDKLTDEEWGHMRDHTIRGARQMLRIEGLPKLAFLGALEHHIRFDGSGYPKLPNWRPNLVSQMIAVADAFDAMRSRRVYQEPKPDAVIIDVLRKSSGTAFNPMLVEKFIRLIKRR